MSLLSCLSLTLSLPLVAQEPLPTKVIVHRPVNLRQGPAPSTPRVRPLLRPPDELDLLEPTPTNGFLHVRTDEAQDGWVWQPNVRLLPPPEGPILPLLSPTIEPAWDKPTPNTTWITITDGTRCYSPGFPGSDQETNIRKNRSDLPVTYHDVDLTSIVTLPYPQGRPKRRDAWEEDDLAAIAEYEGVAVRTTGYLVAYIKVQNKGSGESCNCYSTTSRLVDWHMALVTTEGRGEGQAVVVETTPRVRRHHPKWTPKRLDPWVNSASPVRISGWLFFDPQHASHLGKYRTTLWEIHPITMIEVSQNGHWKNLDDVP